MYFQPQKQRPSTLTRGLLESEMEPHELSLESVLLSRFPACWASCHFPWAGFSLHWAFTMGAFGKLDFCYLASASQGPTRDCFSQVKSKKHHHIYHGSVWFARFCLTAAKIWSDGQTSVMAPCYSSVLLRNQGKIQPRGMRAGQSKRREEKRSPWLNFGSFFLYVFPPPLSLAYVNWASQEGCLLHLRFSLWPLGLPWFYFHRLFPSLSFSQHHFGLLFPILTT